MKKILTLLSFLIAVQLSAQTHWTDINNYQKIRGVWHDSVDIMPHDTTKNKAAGSLAYKTIPYYFNGTKWVPVGSGVIAFDSSILRGVYMDTAYIIEDSIIVFCKGATCWNDTIHTGGSGNPNSNIGAGYRWAVPGTNDIKTFSVGSGLLLDSTTNADELLLTIDTNNIAFDGDTTIVNNFITNKSLLIPRTDTVNAKQKNGSIIFDTIYRHYMGYVDGTWLCLDCSGGGSVAWGDITGTLSDQTDLQAALDAKQDQLNGTGFVKASGTTISYDNSTYVPTTTTITINGTSFDLSTNRSWTVGASNSNIGSGYRWAVPNTNNIKTGFSGYGITIDSSSNTNGLTFTVDTTKISPKFIDVWLIGGQSNGVGRAPSTSGITVPTGRVLQFYNETFSDANDPVGNANQGSAWPAFGLNWYTLTGHNVLFVPAAFGATSQTVAADSGSGNWDTTGVWFDSSVAKLNRALTYIRAQGYTPVVKGILWCQGETDAVGINTAAITQATYEAAFKKMIGRYRAQYRNIPFYIFRIGTDTTATQTGYNQIIQSQTKIADADSLTDVVFWDAIDFPRRHLMSSVNHYTNTGYNEMGRKGAENIVASTGMKWQSSNDTGSINKSLYYVGGNVGINTFNPTAKLYVAGTITATDTTTITTMGNTDSSNRAASTAWVKRQGYGSGGGGSGAFWPLSGLGSITGNDTIAVSAANQLVFGGSFTTTASNQYARKFLTKITSRATTSDIMIGTIINDTFAYTANSQAAVALKIDPVYSIGAFTGTVLTAILHSGQIIPMTDNTSNLGTSAARYLSVSSTNWFGNIWNTVDGTFQMKNGTNMLFYGTPQYTVRIGRFASTGTDSNYSLQVHGEIQSLSGINIVQIPTPTISSITNSGTAGTTSYTYKIVYRDINGHVTAASAAVSTSTGNATLTSTNKNQVIWTAPDGVYNVDVYRTASSGTPSTTGKIGTASGYAGLQGFFDTGLPGDGTTPPADNTTAEIGIGTARPGASLDIKAGVAGVGGAPILLHSGTNLTTAITGAIEYNGTNLFFTRTGTTRESVMTANAVNSVSPTSPNRTITVVIDGTTYYLAAKTTND